MAPTPIRLGALDFLLDDGAVRRIRWRGTEVVRHVSAPVRGTAWDTLPETVVAAASEKIDGRWQHYRETAVSQGEQSAGVALEVRATASEGGARLDIVVTVTARTALDTNRAGLCLLHPLEGVRGTMIEVCGADGGTRRVRLPGADDIAPAQPVRDIAALSQRVNGVDLHLAFDGETFEMEDQRNWTDASFKTYCRPLAAPRPFRLKPNEAARQSIAILIGDDARPARGSDVDADGSTDGNHIGKGNGSGVNGEGADDIGAGVGTGEGVAGASVSSGVADVPSEPANDSASARLPALLLAVEPNWLDTPPIGCDGLLVRFAKSRPWTDEELAWLAEVRAGTGGTLDLEIVVPAGADARDHLTEVRRRLAGVELFPRHVIALPEPYLASHQPDGDWPDGPTPEELVDIARAVFEGISIGAGMLTYFTELNRCPPLTAGGDYVSHGTAAIVHAADTLSVFETLEALPDVFASARRLAGSRPRRLGLVAIGMRENPYGAGLATPTADTFVTMTDRDARHFDARGAAFAVAATLLAARAGVEALCLAAPAGPFGLRHESGAPTPLAKAIDALRALSSAPFEIVGRAPGVLEAIGEHGRLRVNASGERHAGLAAFAIETDANGGGESGGRGES